MKQSVDKLAFCLAYLKLVRVFQMEPQRQTQRQSGRQTTDRETERQTGRQTVKQTWDKQLLYGVAQV